MEQLTAKKAKELSIEIWTFLVENPGKGKHDYPKYNEIKIFVASCPLCEYFVDLNDSFMFNHPCVKCPLCNPAAEGRAYGECNDAYYDWAQAVHEGRTADAKGFAEIVLNAIKNWEI